MTDKKFIDAFGTYGNNRNYTSLTMYNNLVTIFSHWQYCKMKFPLIPVKMDIESINSDKKKHFMHVIYRNNLSSLFAFSSHNLSQTMID